MQAGPRRIGPAESCSNVCSPNQLGPHLSCASANSASSAGELQVGRTVVAGIQAPQHAHKGKQQYNRTSSAKAPLAWGPGYLLPTPTWPDQHAVPTLCTCHISASAQRSSLACQLARLACVRRTQQALCVVTICLWLRLWFVRCRHADARRSRQGCRASTMAVICVPVPTQAALSHAALVLGFSVLPAAAPLLQGCLPASPLGFPND